MTIDEKNALAADMAQQYMRDQFADMMMPNPGLIAKRLREKSDSNIDQSAKDVQEYRGARRCMLSAIYGLLDGVGGYKLVKAEE